MPARKCNIALMAVVTFVAGIGCFSRPSAAQLPVIDSANLLQNTVVASQSVLAVANQLLELTTVDQLLLDSSFYATLAELQGLVYDLQGLSWSYNNLKIQLALLFDPRMAPRSSYDLWRRNQEVRLLIYEGYASAVRIQTILFTFQRLVTHIISLTGRISRLVGNLSAQQSLNEWLAKGLELQSQSYAITTAWQRAQATEGLDAPYVQQSLEHITEEVMKDHPR